MEFDHNGQCDDASQEWDWRDSRALEWDAEQTENSREDGREVQQKQEENHHKCKRATNEKTEDDKKPRNCV